MFVPAVVLERLGRLPGAASSAVAADTKPLSQQARFFRALANRWPFPLRPMKPQHIVVGGAKWIAITIVHRVDSLAKTLVALTG